MRKIPSSERVSNEIAELIDHGCYQSEDLLSLLLTWQ